MYNRISNKYDNCKLFALMEDECLVSCIAFVYANSKKEALYLQEAYNGIRKHYTNMEKRYEDMNATIRAFL